jgi:predicted Zn-dependent peptidase
MIFQITTRILAIILATITFGTSIGAQQPSSAPNPSTAQALVYPEISYKRMLNDLQVVVASTPYLGDSMTIGLVVRYGSAFDPTDKGGLAYLVSRMFLKATQDKAAKDIQDEMNFLGATIEVRCDWDNIRFILRGQSARFERSLLLLYQVVGEAVFNEADFAKTKEESLASLDQAEDPRQQIRSRFDAALFQGTTYGRPLRGTKASLANINLGDVRLFYRRYFSSHPASLIVVGSAPTPQVLQKATRIWGIWVRKDEVPFTFLPPRSPSSRSIVLDDDPASPAAQFVLGNLWPRRDEPGFLTGVVASRVLQERLTAALPTSLVTVGVDGRRLTSLFYIQGQAAADQAVLEIKKILDTVEESKNSGPGAEEMAAAKNRLIEEFKKSLGATDSLCNLLLDAELYKLGTNYLAAFPDYINRTAPESVKETIKQWIFPGGVLIYVRGPAASLKSSLESLGSFHPVP